MGYRTLSRKDTARYLVEHRTNEETGAHEIVMTSRIGGGYYAIHRNYNLINSTSNDSSIQVLDEFVADLILRKFELKGDTEAFNVYDYELTPHDSVGRTSRECSPEAIRHIITPQENTFTATGAKLWHHWPIFLKYRETGYGSIIRATLTNHQICSSRCNYCSTISRNKRDSITLDEAKRFVQALYYDQAEHNQLHFDRYNKLYREVTGSDIRLRGLILSGGGQPNLWEHFSEFMHWIADLDIDVGLITNGFPRHIDEEIYTRFKWIRISITPEDASPFYPDGHFNKQYIPQTIKNNPDLTVGYSYVFGQWTNDDVIKRIEESLSSNGFNYCRLLTDCNLTRSSQLRAHERLAERLFKLDLIDASGKPIGKIFQQLKYHGTADEAQSLWESGQCYLQSYNVFWDTTGHEEKGYSYCYPCDSVTVLASEQDDGSVASAERKFNPDKWGTVINTEVSRLFTEPVKPYFDPRQLCMSCLFMRNNQVIKSMLSQPDMVPTDIQSDLEHINFP